MFFLCMALKVKNRNLVNILFPYTTERDSERVVYAFGSFAWSAFSIQKVLSAAMWVTVWRRQETKRLQSNRISVFFLKGSFSVFFQSYFHLDLFWVSKWAPLIS